MAVVGGGGVAAGAGRAVRAAGARAAVVGGGGDGSIAARACRVVLGVGGLCAVRERKRCVRKKKIR